MSDLGPLDPFLASLYLYWEEGGLFPFLTRRVVANVRLLFVISFTAFLLLAVNWDRLQVGVLATTTTTMNTMNTTTTTTTSTTIGTGTRGIGPEAFRVRVRVRGGHVRSAPRTKGTLSSPRDDKTRAASTG